jgi:hypothetical protein
MKNPDDVLKHMYKPEAGFLIYGHITRDYLIESKPPPPPPPHPPQKKASLLTTYSQPHTINFATSIQNNSSTAVDNIFVDKSRINLSSISTTINGLSDNDSQILTTENM